MKTIAVIATLVLAFFPQMGRAAESTPAPATEPSTTALREKFIASLRTDIVALRKSKDTNNPAIVQLAQAIDAAAAETTDLASWLHRLQGSSEGRSNSWLATAQAYGSEKSATLAAQLATQMRQERLADAAAFTLKAEATGKRIATTFFTAKSAPELDAPLAELASFAPSQYSLPASPEAAAIVGNLQALQQLVQSWQSYLTLREAGRPGDAWQALRNLRGNDRQIPWIARSEMNRKIEEAGQLAGRPSPEDLNAKSASFLQRAIAAEKASEIDAVLIEARRLQTILQQDDSGSLGYRFNSVITFLERWQDILSAGELGDGSRMREAINQVTNNSDIRQLDLPRSQMLDRLANIKVRPSDSLSTAGTKDSALMDKPEAVLARMKTLADLEQNVPLLQAAVQLENSQGISDNRWQSITSELSGLTRDYQLLQNGTAVRLQLALNGGGNPSAPQVFKLRQQLAVLGLQRLLGDDAKLPPEANENALTYLRRLLSAARERKDWRLVQSVLDTSQSGGIQDPLLRPTDSSALNSFLAGLNQERAGQWATAVTSYQNALKTGSSILPIDEIGERLQRLQKEHSVEYDQGVQWSMNPPITRDPYGPYGPNSPYPAGIRSIQGRQPMGEQPILIPESRNRATPTLASEAKPAEAKPPEKPSATPAATPASAPSQP